MNIIIPLKIYNEVFIAVALSVAPSVSPSIIIPPQNKCFADIYWNKPVCLSVCPSVLVFVCVQNTTFCQSTGGSIKSHLVTVLVWSVLCSFLSTLFLNNLWAKVNCTSWQYSLASKDLHITYCSLLNKFFKSYGPLMHLSVFNSLLHNPNF